MAPTDTMGYAFIHWLLLPIAAFVISLRIGTGPQGWAHVAAAWPQLLYMLADFHLPARQYVGL